MNFSLYFNKFYVFLSVVLVMLDPDLFAQKLLATVTLFSFKRLNDFIDKFT